jgi:hypothetical protein
MALDLRLAIGWLLLAIGLQLTGYGLLSDAAGAGLNVTWGGGITAAGLAFYAASRWGGKR